MTKYERTVEPETYGILNDIQNSHISNVVCSEPIFDKNCGSFTVRLGAGILITIGIINRDNIIVFEATDSVGHLLQVSTEKSCIISRNAESFTKTVIQALRRFE